MILDKTEVEVDDRIYCLKHGYGTVEQLNSRFVVVKFNNTRARYTLDGRMGSELIRTLYWHDPILIIPAYDPDTWALVKDLSFILHRVATSLTKRINNGSL